MSTNTFSNLADEAGTHAGAGRGFVSLLLELGKTRLSAMVVLTTVVGAVVASPGPIDWMRLLLTALGTGLAAWGANALNEVVERREDGRMERTRERPLPAGAMTLRAARAFALGAAVAGLLLLALTVNLLTAGLSALTVLLYVLVYTPLKKRNAACTLVGAVCGAIPPMMGVTSVLGRVDVTAGLLFLLLFIWQIPHFLALAWMYRDDYAAGGFRMMPLTDPDGDRTTRTVVVYTLLLVPLAVMMTAAGLGGWLFAAGAVALGIWFTVLTVRLRRTRTDAMARRVFFASLIYLPLLLGLLVLDRGPADGLSPWQEEGFHLVSVTADGPTP